MRAANPYPFPTLFRESLYREVFPFESWAVANGFQFPTFALPVLKQCGSAAEAFFVRVFAERDGCVIGHDNEDSLALEADGTRLLLQVRHRGYRIDAVVMRARAELAIEIDGLAFHHRRADQVAADYLRERRLVLGGYNVIRFTAPEVFRQPAECWRQVDAILEARS